MAIKVGGTTVIDDSLSTTADPVVGSVFAGTAVSSTKLIVKG